MKTKPHLRHYNYAKYQETLHTPKLIKGLVQYDDTTEKQKWVQITEIVVPTEYDKEQLLLAIKYIHDLRNLDTGYLAVNHLLHLYLHPELIVVREEIK